MNKAVHYTPKPNSEELITEQRCKAMHEQLVKDIKALAQQEDVHEVSVVQEIEDIIKARRHKTRDAKDDKNPEEILTYSLD